MFLGDIIAVEILIVPRKELNFFIWLLLYSLYF